MRWNPSPPFSDSGRGFSVQVDGSTRLTSRGVAPLCRECWRHCEHSAIIFLHQPKPVEEYGISPVMICSFP
jgi:hypothetical protein